MSSIFTSQRKPARPIVIDHFISGQLDSSLGWNIDVAGGGSSVSAASGQLNAPGTRRIQAGAPPAARAAILLQLYAFRDLNLNQYDFESSFALQTLSGGGVNYICICGFVDTVTSTTINFGTYFIYNQSLYGSQWRCVNVNSGASTVVNSGVAATAGGLAFNQFRIKTNGAGGALYYINNQLVATINTNTPVWPTANTTYAFCLFKNGGGGTIYADLDFVKIYVMPHLTV